MGMSERESYIYAAPSRWDGWAIRAGVLWKQTGNLTEGIQPISHGENKHQSLSVRYGDSPRLHGGGENQGAGPPS